MKDKIIQITTTVPDATSDCSVLYGLSESGRLYRLSGWELSKKYGVNVITPYKEHWDIVTSSPELKEVSK